MVAAVGEGWALKHPSEASQGPDLYTHTYAHTALGAGSLRWRRASPAQPQPVQPRRKPWLVAQQEESKRDLGSFVLALSHPIGYLCPPPPILTLAFLDLSPPLNLASQDTMEYKKKQRPLKIRMLDGTVKTVMVDDSKTVTDMLMTICARIGEQTGQLG